MAEPRTGDYDIVVRKRSTSPLDITYKSGGNPVDITGYTFAAQVYNKDRSVKYADYSVTYTNRSQGKVLFKLTPAQTETFNVPELEYDVKFRQPDGDEEYLIGGTIYVNEGYTVIP